MKVTEEMTSVSINTNRVINYPSRHPHLSGAAQERTNIRRDQVTISETAESVGEAAAHIKALPDVDMEKVARIKAKIQNGTYKVDARKAAAGMLTESLLQDQ